MAGVCVSDSPPAGSVAPRLKVNADSLKPIHDGRSLGSELLVRE